MCAIAGIFDLRDQRPIDERILRRMANRMRHRGPDGEGYFTAPGIGLAHRRLAIIDLDGGAQPWHLEEPASVLTYNGEVYNHADLARDLRGRGIGLASRCDTEVLAQGFSRFGVPFLSGVNGMFAFGHWDVAARQLSLVRDRLGEKPLYYGISPDGFLVFASEIGAVLASGLFEGTLDPEAVADFFWFGYVPDPKCIYRHIHKLPPGCVLTARQGHEPAIAPWWSIDYGAVEPPAYEDVQETLNAHLERAVHGQMIADVPLGAFLSGGADSAAIVSTMVRKPGARPVTCSIGFANSPDDERASARQLSAHLGTTHHEEMASLDALTLIDETAAAFGEPFADSSALPTAQVARLARQHVRVALSGDGGDEIFAGYRRYGFFLAEERLRRRMPTGLRETLFRPLGQFYPKLDRFPRALRFKTTFQALGDDQGTAYARATAIQLPDQIQTALAPDFQQQLAGYEPADQVRDQMVRAGTDDPLGRALYTDLHFWLAGRMLVKVDRASMMHSLEVRPPLLDHQLVTWAAGLPSAFKHHRGQRKRLLKDCIRPSLPPGYLDQPKRGFNLPLTQWFDGPATGGADYGNHGTANPLIDRLLNAPAIRTSAILNPDGIDQLIREHQRGQRNHAQMLWSLTMFDAFLRQSGEVEKA
ncbi:MAG: asparagine synthase (glutamine-hydrolyzing) [Pseudomonadota bacterium]